MSEGKLILWTSLATFCVIFLSALLVQAPKDYVKTTCTVVEVGVSSGEYGSTPIRVDCAGLVRKTYAKGSEEFVAVGDTVDRWVVDRWYVTATSSTGVIALWSVAALVASAIVGCFMTLLAAVLPMGEY